MPGGRNAFLGVVATLLLGVGTIVDAQPATKIHKIGWLDASDAAAAHDATGDFRQGLRDLKYFEGQNVTLEYRHAGGKIERLAELAAELVRLRVDVIVTAGESAALAAKRATSAIPIVATELAQDPVKAGLVASLGRPGGNVEGRGARADLLQRQRWARRIAGALPVLVPLRRAILRVGLRCRSQRARVCAHAPALNSAPPADANIL